jgi:hypothetical protein
MDLHLYDTTYHDTTCHEKCLTLQDIVQLIHCTSRGFFSFFLFFNFVILKIWQNLHYTK